MIEITQSSDIFVEQSTIINNKSHPVSAQEILTTARLRKLKFEEYKQKILKTEDVRVKS